MAVWGYVVAVLPIFPVSEPSCCLSPLFLSRLPSPSRQSSHWTGITTKMIGMLITSTIPWRNEKQPPRRSGIFSTCLQCTILTDKRLTAKSYPEKTAGWGKGAIWISLWGSFSLFLILLHLDGSNGAHDDVTKCRASSYDI